MGKPKVLRVDGRSRTPIWMILLIVTIGLFTLYLWYDSKSSPYPTFTPTKTSASPSPQLTPTPSPSPTPTSIPTMTPATTPSPTPTPTPTLQPTATPTPTLTVTMTPSHTPQPTPLMMPGEGQYATYLEITYNSTGGIVYHNMINTTYSSYVSRELINITLLESTGFISDSLKTFSSWLAVDVYTRLVVDSSDPWYIDKAWDYWIERDISLGSTVDMSGPWGVEAVLVDGEREYVVLGRSRDCWELVQDLDGAIYRYYFDKATGLMVGSEGALELLEWTVKMELVSTNII